VGRGGGGGGGTDLHILGVRRVKRLSLISEQFETHAEISMMKCSSSMFLIAFSSEDIHDASLQIASDPNGVAAMFLSPRAAENFRGLCLIESKGPRRATKLS